MASCQKGPTRHAYAWQIGPFRQDTLDIPGTVMDAAQEPGGRQHLSADVHEALFSSGNKHFA